MTHKKRYQAYMKLLFFIVTTILLTVSFVLVVYFDSQSNDSAQIKYELDEDEADFEVIDELILESEKENEEDVKSNSIVTLAATGDIMFHGPQLNSARRGDSYDFTPMFADVKPILSSADLTIANFETTLGGPSLGFSGYPQFNSPDEVADAIKDAGVDILTTVNNHSLDTRADGLKRTVRVLQDKGFKTVGTYEEEPDSRVLTYEINDITFAILAYTESTNGLGDLFSDEELNAMLNLMTKENIERDIKEAQSLDVDFIITFMHWGDEYATEPNEKQIEYAHFMADLGVDLILGSHPHVIQPNDQIKTIDQTTFIVYSMGNFISNQRRETLGKSFAPTEDGVIVHFVIEKDYKLEETTITEVDYTPTWVYKNMDANNKPLYRILPIEDFLTSNQIDDSFKTKMKHSYEATMSQMDPEA